jgi:hypothetical protein
MDLTTKGAALIQIATVIDLEKIVENYQNPSTNKQYPTGIAWDEVSMTCTGSRGNVNGQGSTNLEFSAYIGDVVSFNATIASNSSAYAANIYRIGDNGGDRVFNMEEIKEGSIEFKVYGIGLARLSFYFGIYTKDANGKPEDLIGCFYFDPYITVRS